MSTIDSPKIILDLLKRGGADRDGEARHTTGTIWEYTSGFGNTCYKLIYSLYSSGMTQEEASNIFLSTGNIKPGTTCRAILFNGQITEYGKLWMEAVENLLRQERLNEESRKRRTYNAG